jgi:outer membrane protein TolC
MKKLNYIIVATAVSLMLTGCDTYKKFELKNEAPAEAFGISKDIKEASGNTSISQMSWRQFFTDPMLQQLIEQVLANNTDVNSARIAVEKSEAALKAARMAYLPALSFAPQGALTSFDGSPVAKTYNLPLQLSMDIDALDSISKQKRSANAVLMQAQIQKEAVCANLIATTA